MLCYLHSLLTFSHEIPINKIFLLYSLDRSPYDPNQLNNYITAKFLETP